MKIISWNVNGLRAILKKNFEEILAGSDADIFCIQETKIQEGQANPQTPGYTPLYNHARRPGYSGTAVYSRRPHLRASRGIGVEEHDTEGRVLTVEYDTFTVVNVYSPNSRTGLERLPYRLEWEAAFRRYVADLDRRKPVIICGDLNVAHQEEDLRNPRNNRNNPGFSDAERRAMDQLLDAGFIDTYRTLHPDGRDYSWWSYRYNARAKNIGWRIDYVLVSQRLLPRLVSASILTGIAGSDHAPVTATFDL